MYLNIKLLIISINNDTTNTISAEELAVGDTLTPGTTGILEKTEATEGMLWQVVRVYTMPDGQKGVKLMRIA